MPYGQKKKENCISIVIYALRAKEKIKFKQFLNLGLTLIHHLVFISINIDHLTENSFKSNNYVSKINLSTT